MLKIQLCDQKDKLHVLKLKMFYVNFYNISQCCCFHCIFDQLNASLESITDFFKNIKKQTNLTRPKPLF